MSLQLATPVGAQLIVPGSTFVLPVHVHDTAGNNFNWNGYTPRATLVVGTVTVSVQGTVTNQAGGLATYTFTVANISGLPNNQWGLLVLYADPITGNENRHIASIFCRVAKENCT